MKLPWTKSSATTPSTGEVLQRLDLVLSDLAMMAAKLDQITTALAAAGLTLGPLKVVARQPLTPPRKRTDADVVYMTREERQRRQMDRQQQPPASPSTTPTATSASTSAPADAAPPASSASPGASTTASASTPT